jgi:hypothetical protein
MTKTPFFCSIHRRIDAVNSCPELAICFTMDSHELKAATLEHQNKSSIGALDGCVGGTWWVALLHSGSKQKQTFDVLAYFPEPYQYYGVKVQACCDARCRFTWFSVRYTEGTGIVRNFMLQA